MTELIIFLIVVVLAFYIGRRKEALHYLSIRERESKLRNIPLCTFGKKITKSTLEASFGKGVEIEDHKLVTGHAVIAHDMFKSVLAGFVQLFGGELKTHSSLLDRARREAVLRMLEPVKNCDVVYNVRIETSNISASSQNSTGSIEALAYGTAVTLRRNT